MFSRSWYALLIFMNMFNLTVDIHLERYNFYTFLDAFFLIFFSYLFLKTFEKVEESP
jgi:hypothetical protein